MSSQIWLVLITFMLVVPLNGEEFYVSPIGSDSNPGTFDRPLQSFLGARNRVRTIINSTAGDITVYFRKGEYVFNKTVVLDLRDTGRADHRITYSNYHDEQAIFTSGTRVKNWQKISASDPAYTYLPAVARSKVYVAHLPVGMDKLSFLNDSSRKVDSRRIGVIRNSNNMWGTVPGPGESSDQSKFYGKTSSMEACATACSQNNTCKNGFWIWYSSDYTSDYRYMCYFRVDGVWDGKEQEFVFSGRMVSAVWQSRAKWDLSQYVTTKHFVHGADVEGEMWDPPLEKMTLNLSTNILPSVRNEPSALYVRAFLSDFNQDMVGVTRISQTPSGSQVMTKTPMTYRMGKSPGYCDDSSFNFCWPSVWLENALAGIVSSGQWVVLPGDRKVYLWPSGLESIEDDIIAFAGLSEYIRVEGYSGPGIDDDKPVQYLTFQGLHFTMGDAIDWEKDDAGGTQHDYAMLDKSNALLRFRVAQYNSIINCSFTHSGGVGVRFDLYAQNNTVNDCLFSYLGREAVHFGGYGIGQKNQNHHNALLNSEIHHIGQLKWDSPGVVVWQSGFNRIEGNAIHHTPSKAILLSAPRDRAFVPNDTEWEQGWRMARWKEVDQNALGYIQHHEGSHPTQYLVCPSGKGDVACDQVCFPFRFNQGNIVTRNIFHHVGTERDRTFFGDGIIYITAVGSVHTLSDRNSVTDNIFFDNPGTEGGPPLNQIIYLDAFSGSLIFERNVVFRSQVRFILFNLAPWYPLTQVTANIFFDDLYSAQGGGDPPQTTGCTLPNCRTQGNVALDNPDDPFSKPNKKYLQEYIIVYNNVCYPPSTARGSLSGAHDFLVSLRQEIIRLGGSVSLCPNY